MSILFLGLFYFWTKVQLQEDICIATPDTILHRHRELIAKKWDDCDRRQWIGRQCTKQERIEQIVQMVKENPSWGYGRIEVVALKNLGILVCDTTIGKIFRDHGFEPASERKLLSECP